MNINKEKKRKKVSKEECDGHFGQILLVSFFPQFFLYFGEKIFDEPAEKTPRLHLLFSFLPIQTNTLQKSFSSYFLFKVFHPPYFTSTQSHS